MTLVLLSTWSRSGLAARQAAAFVGNSAFVPIFFDLRRPSSYQ
jgi:hypothetical protein